MGGIGLAYYKNKEKSVEIQAFKTIKESFSNWKILVILGLFLFVFSPIANAAIRDTLTYQGKILDASMLPPVDGNYNMQFTIYDSLSGGNLLWTETWNAGNQVSISDGVFTVELNNICASWIGACASNGGVSWSSDSLYLQIGFDADGNGSFEETFAPRKRFTAVPYAQMAARLETASNVLFTDNTDHSLAWNQASDRTLTVENTNAANVANLAVEGQVRIGQFAAAPTALGNGALYYNTANHNLYLYQNSAWQIVGGGGGSGDAIWDADTDTGIQTEESADEDKIRFDIGNASGTAYPDILVIDGVNGFVWNDSGAAALDFRIEGDTDANLLFVDAGNNNIGIGEAAPDTNAKLEVAGNLMIDDYLYFQNTTTDYLRFDASDFILSNDLLPSANKTYNLGASNARWSKLFLGGNSLHIGDDANDYDISYDTVNNLLVFNEGGENTGLRLEGDTHQNLLLIDATNDRVGFGIDDLTLFDNRVTIENSTTDGVLRLVGPDGTYGHGARLRFGDGDLVYMDEYADDNFQIYAAGNMYLSTDAAGGNIYMPKVYNNTAGSPRRALYIDSVGMLGYQASSIRYKEHVVDMSDISWLYDLRPVNFDYKDRTETKYDKQGNAYTVTVPGGDETEYGLIAEEVELVNPDLVSYNEEGLVETVEYDKLAAPMLKAIQDQNESLTPILERIKIADNGLEINRYNASDEVDALLIYQDSDDSAGLHLVKTGTGTLGQQAAIYVSAAKNSSAGDNDGIQSGYGLYINSEMTGTAKVLGIETDDITGGNVADTEAFYVRADGVTKVYEGNVIPTFNEDGEFGFYTNNNTRRLYFESNGTRAYINRSGTGDYSEYFKTRDLTLQEDWGTVVVTDNSGSEMKVLRSVEYKDKNILGIVSELGTRNNDDDDGMRHEDPNWVNIAMLGQVPVKVTNQNGPIAVGDYLTSSSVIGHAMKADPGDPVLGIAMEPFSGTVNSSEGKINCLLSRNNQGNISTLLKDLQERKTLTAEEVLAVINNESLALNYLVMTKGEVMEGLKVHGELELDRQNIGSAVVLSGEQRVRVYFPERFRVKPIVTVSPELTTDNEIFFDFQYLLYDVNADGFSIKLNQPLDYDLRFNWQAFAQADYSNNFEIGIPDSTPVNKIQPLVSFDCRADNLSACVTARDCWQFADVAKWTGSSCVLK